MVLPPHYTEIFQCSSITCGVKMVIYWGQSFQVVFKPLSKCFWRLSYVFLITFHPVTFVSVYDATFLCFKIFGFRCHQSLMVLPPLKNTWIPCSCTHFYTFTKVFGIWYHYIVSFDVRVGTGTVAYWFLLVDISFWMVRSTDPVLILFKAHLGYLHLVRTFCTCSCSSCNCCEVEHTVLDLTNSVLITLYFAEMAWWLSHCRYWSVWIGFLKTVVIKLPSDCGMTKVSRKGIEPSALVFSAVNCMPLSIELIWLKNSSLCVDLMTTNVSSTNPFHRRRG